MSTEEDHIDDLTKALLGQDELGAVIRAHILVEARLLELLELLVSNEDYLRRMNLEFSQHVDLAVALGLNSELAKGLRAFGKLRNDFAHRIGSHLSEERVRSLYEALSSHGKEVVQKAFTATLTEQEKHLSFDDVEPKEKFVMIATALHALLEVAIMETRKRGGNSSGR